jgi:LmbE family N-acetylglucosaminyl deacetylase
LVVAPHPDDETLGAGGTLLKLAAGGADLHWLLMTSAKDTRYSSEYVIAQKHQVQNVRAAYPFASLNWLGYPASTLNACPRGGMVEAVRAVVSNLRPEVILLPHAHDVHDDHAVTHATVIAACKAFYMREFGVNYIASMEIPSETDAGAYAPERLFQPSIIVDISDHLERKIEIFKLYQTEHQSGFRPRRPDALRAIASANGTTYDLAAAERFMLLKALLP